MAVRADDEILVGCVKRSYLTRVAAEREAGLHASWSPSCEKCADGSPFVAYRCREARTSGHIWHVGHDATRKEDTMPAATADPTLTLRPGDIWVATAAKSLGQAVKIHRVGSQQVYFRAHGRGVTDAKMFKATHEAFLQRYAPGRAAATDRQERLDRAAAKFDALPVSPSAPEPLDAVIEDVAAPTSAPLIPLKRSPGTAKISGEQAREVYELMKTIPDGVSVFAHRAEVAALYGLDPRNVYDIERGKSFAWATGQPLISSPRRVKPAPPEIEAPPDPEPPQQEEPPVQITQQPTVIDSRPSITPVEQALVRTDTLALEMADALEVLVEYAGKPLPKFIRLDFDAIRGLIEQARAVS